MNQRIVLPREFTSLDLDKFLGQIIAPDGKFKDKSYVFDLKSLEFINGFGLTAFSNVLEFAQRSKVSTVIETKGMRELPLAYLHSCGFMKRYVNEDGPLPISKKTTLPLELIEHVAAFDWTGTRASPWLQRTFDLPPEAFASLINCLREVFNNIGDHSRETIGCVHMQYYPANDDVEITISDFGAGIPATVARVYPGLSDQEALLKATEEGFTTLSRINNRGAGLSILADYVAREGGRFSLYSGRGRLRITGDDSGLPQRQAWTSGVNYPGTMVELTFKRFGFAGDTREDEPFSYDYD